MSGVSIIGVGLHPFGRFAGKQAMDMGAEAIRLALKDAGIGWDQVQRGYAGSLEASNPDAVVGKLGLTGIPFFGVFNGCATANTAISLAAEAIEHGEADIAIAVGFDKPGRRDCERLLAADVVGDAREASRCRRNPRVFWSSDAMLVQNVFSPAE